MWVWEEKELTGLFKAKTFEARSGETRGYISPELKKSSAIWPKQHWEKRPPEVHCKPANCKLTDKDLLNPEGLHLRSPANWIGKPEKKAHWCKLKFCVHVWKCLFSHNLEERPQDKEWVGWIREKNRGWWGHLCGVCLEWLWDIEEPWKTNRRVCSIHELSWAGKPLWTIWA